MRTVSNLFKATLASGGRTYKVYASFVLANGDTLELGSEDIWSGSVTLDTATSGTGSFDVGAFVMSQVSFTVNNLDGGYSDHYFDGARVRVDLGLILTDGTEERVHLGVFNVNRTNAVNSSLIQLTALDNAVKFEKPYALSTLTYPATIGTIIRDACSSCGVTLNTQTWAGDDMVVQARPEKEYSFRQIISYAAQACGLFARMNNAGYLELGWYDTSALRSVDDEDTWEGISAALKAKYHHIKSLSSTNINTDIIAISGVSVVVGSGQDTYERTVGTNAYLLQIKENPLVDRQNQQDALTYIAANTVGMEFYKFSINCLSDPTIEAGDLIWITDKDGKDYRAPITLTSFKVGSYEHLECSATLPQENKSYHVPASTIALIKAEKAARERIDKWAERQTALSELISAGYGMYTTDVAQADGSVISYMHDKPTMAESSVIWTKTAEGLMLSRDGGATFALDSYGHALVETLTAHGVSADWINTGELVVRDALGNETMYVNCDTGEVRINATSFSLTGKTVPQIIAEQVEDVEVGARNLLFNSSFSENFDKWDKNARYELVTEDGHPCGHIAGGTGAYAINQDILERIKDDEADQLYTVSGDIKLVNYADNSGSQVPYLSFYLTGHYLDGSGNSKWIGATRVGGTVGESSQRQFMPFSDQGWVRVNYIFKFAKKPSELTDMAFDIYTRNWSGDLYFKNLKLERGNKATDWTPAPEDLQTSITNANTTAQQANATANAANTTAQQALDVASSAGGMSAYLDNDYQSIPTDADGTYTTFPECSTAITVFYNSADVSAQCNYTATPSAGVTGSWNASTRTYTVTGMTTDSGTVTIKADYNNTSLSRKFSIAKVKRGAAGTDGRDGTDGTDGTDGRGVSQVSEFYQISASGTTVPSSWETTPVKPTVEAPYLWSFMRVSYTDSTTADTAPRVIGNYAADGQDGTNGRGVQSVTAHYGLSTSINTEPAEWSDTMVMTSTTNKYLWSYETITYTDGTTTDTTKRIIGTHGATGTAAYTYTLLISDAAIVKNSDGTLSPSTLTLTARRAQGTGAPANYSGRFKIETSTDGTTWTAAYTSSSNVATYIYTVPAGVKLIRCSLYLAGGTTTLLDSQTVPIVADGVDGTDGVDGVSPTITSSKSNGVTTVTITDKNGTRTLTINDGKNGSYVKTITNYYFAASTATGITTSTVGWTTDPASSQAKLTAAKPYLWNYEVLKDETGKTISTTSPAVIGRYGTDGADGTNGADGANGKGIKSITEYYALSTSTTEPVTADFSTTVKTPTAEIRYLWNYEKIVYTDDSSTTTSKHIIGVYGESGKDGADAYTVILTNENHVFEAGSSAAVAGSTECGVIAYKGATRVPATIGTITGKVTGMTTEVKNNSTTTAAFVVNVTTSLKTISGELSVPVSVDNKSFTKKFSWALARNGTDGVDGAPARTYFLKVSPKSTKIVENLTFDPNSVTVKAYYRDGNVVTQNAFSGHLTLQACVNGSWSTLKTLTASEYTFSLAYTSKASASISGTTVSLPSTASALRVQLRATSSGVILDQEEIIVLIDATSITQETIWRKLTNNGETQGVYMEGGKIYVNASYIGTGTLNADRLKGISMKLGGDEDEHGLLTVVDAGNQETVRLDHLGIHAIAGNIGNWEIINNTIRREKHDDADVLLQAPVVGASAGSTVLAIGAPTVDDKVSWGDAPFRVTKIGAMYSTKGYIGGWEITTNSIRNATKGSAENALLGAGTKYPLSVGASWATSDSAPNWGGAVFRVQNTGHLTAKSANITGTFTTTDGKQSITMQNGIIYGKQGTTESGIIDMSAEYPSDGGGNRNIAVKGNYALRLQGGNTITLEVPALEKRAWVTRNGLTAQELHAVNGYSGYITFPVSIDPNKGTILEYIRLPVVDGIIRG